MSQQFKIWLPRLLSGLAAGVFLWSLWPSLQLFADYNHRVIAFPYPVDYGEGPILDQVLRLAHFENIYSPNFDLPPYRIANYPPLYLLVQLPFAWITGPALWYGRSISLLGVLATALFIGLTLHYLTKDLLASTVGALLLLALPYILYWSPFCRVDSLALGLSWAGLFVIVRWNASRKGLFAGALLLTAAVFTRQSYALAAPLAAFMWLFATPPRRRAFKLAGEVAGMGLGLFLCLNLVTRGGFFLNIVAANVNPFFWHTVKDHAVKIWDRLPYLLVSSVAFGAIAFRLRQRSWWLVTPYLLGGALSALMIGKDGSNVNYLYELCAGLSLAAGALLALPGRQWPLKIALIVPLVWQVHVLFDWSRQEYYSWVMQRIRRDAPDIIRLQEIVREADGPVLADEYMALIPLAGKRLVFQPFEFKQLAAAGLWDQQFFLNAIAQQEFAAILLYDPPTWEALQARWTGAQLAAIEAHYHRAGRYADTTVYRPR
jgi:hypothetical protein